ncbi:histidine kinase [Krasilnikovia cinnamomea]|uniref:histidine kinase n=1 Tax=Krasilnikovia cinnamomea TaxID=349313 RepID=A0A4Q7ZGG9_9ACTN|nr:histidine kinase [Krasilnikovia cinnamomea]
MGRVRGAVAGCAAALAFSLTAIAASWQESSGQLWLDAGMRLWGLVGVVVGTVVWVRAPQPHLGRLMVWAAAVWHLNFLRGVDQPVVAAVGFCGAYAWTAALGHVLYTWPTGRATTRLARLFVPVGYVASIGTQVLVYVVDGPTVPRAFGQPGGRTAAAAVGSVVFAVLAANMIGIMLWRWVRASRMRRRSATPVWTFIVVACATGVAVALVALLDLPRRIEMALMLAAMVTSLPFVPLIHVVQRNRSRTATWRVAQVALREDQPATEEPAPARLERSLAEAVGDPTLRLLYPAPGGGYVDGAGKHLPELPGDGSGRAVTPVERRGRLMAVIEHDEALHNESTVAEAAGAAAGLALENAHLYATLHAQIDQLHDSRHRIATSALAERRRIQRDLHDGAQQELFAVLVLLDMARRASDPEAATGMAHRAHRQLGDAIASLRLLTEGIYPATLVEHGLTPAVESLVDRAPLPVTVDTSAGRHQPDIEITAYFVVAEALGNVYKHANATQVHVSIRCRDGSLVLRIADDGRGDADPDGTGLRALADRVATVGGTLTITAGEAGGTVVVADFPLRQPCLHVRGEQPCTS